MSKRHDKKCPWEIQMAFENMKRFSALLIISIQIKAYTKAPFLQPKTYA